MVLLAPVLLLAAYLHNPVLSHNIVEMFCVVVACGIFMLTWNARGFIDNHYFIFLGTAYLFVGGIDYLHSMTFDELLTAEHHSVTIELWFAARFLQSFAYLAAPLFTSRKARPLVVLAGFSVAAVVLVGMVYRGIFPDYYVPGKGLTHYKSEAEYIVVGIQILAIGALWRVRGKFDQGVFRLLVLSILFSAAADISANFYTDAYIYNSAAGHYLKFVSFYLVYKAIIGTSLVRPYRLMFRNLQISASEIRAARDTLESQVDARRADLRTANRRLEEELDERQRAEEMRGLILDLHQLIISADEVRDLLSSLTSFLNDRFGFEAVGIRFRHGTDFPYFETRGFPPEFVQAEMSLCPTGRSGVGEDAEGGEPPLECACGAVVEGRCDPSSPFFTPAGTFWTNSSSDLLAADGAIRTIASRGRCFRQGYESVGLVPVRLGDATFGLLQFNDRRKGMFSPRLLARLERVAENVAPALSRLLAREALRESEDRFRSLVENSSIGILIVQEGRIVYRNPWQEQLFGRIPDGLPFRELGLPLAEDAGKFGKLCDAMDDLRSERQDTDIRFLLPQGDTGRTMVRWFQCQTDRINFLGHASFLVNMGDITRIKDLEQIVMSREKLAAFGQLSAGIAHEIRNPLSGININVSTLDLLCQRTEGLEPEEKERIRTVIAQVRAASVKISSVIKRIMEFSRTVPPRMDRIDLNRVFRDTLGLTEITNRKRGVELRVHLSPEPLFCRADPTLLGQVLLNLVTNGLQSMETAGSPGRLTVSLGGEGNLAVLRVADTGPGVPGNLRDKIFEPFYTTRKDGHGIGLSFSHRIVSDHGGRLSVGDAEGGGAEFRVEIPLEGERSPA